MSLKPSRQDITKLLARLSAVFGQPKDRSEDQARMMVTEWHRATSHLPFEAVDEAIERAIRSLKFWPTPAEVIGYANEHLIEMKSQLEHAELMANERPSLQITRGGHERPYFKPTGEEIARVAAKVAAFRERMAKHATVERPEVPASQDPHVSEELKALVRKQRASETGNPAGN